jgi:hypothetical protein
MKNHLNTLALSAALATSLHAHGASGEQAEKYLLATHLPAMLQKQVDGYTEQYAKGQDAAYRQRVHDYLERVMGWEVLKKDYLSIVQDLYTEREINAFLRYASTPEGRSMLGKSATFANRLGAISAKRAQEASAGWQLSGSNGGKDLAASSTDLVVAKVEKFQNGDQVYFTGEISNKGKTPAQSVTVEVNLFRGDRFVDQYSSYITGTIQPGSSRLFKISCGCKGSPPAEHDSFKVLVVGGY